MNPTDLSAGKKKTNFSGTTVIVFGGGSEADFSVIIFFDPSALSGHSPRGTLTPPPPGGRYRSH